MFIVTFLTAGTNELKRQSCYKNQFVFELIFCQAERDCEASCSMSIAMIFLLTESSD